MRTPPTPSKYAPGSTVIAMPSTSGIFSLLAQPRPFVNLEAQAVPGRVHERLFHSCSPQHAPRRTVHRAGRDAGTNRIERRKLRFQHRAVQADHFPPRRPQESHPGHIAGVAFPARPHIY